MEIRFWGVRGSVAASGSGVAKIGGNTSCVEVTHGGHRLIFDAGTGIRALGDLMLKQSKQQTAGIFFSHVHWDHVQGFPFFTPAYLPSTELTLYGAGDIESALAHQMKPPHFPVTLSAMRAKLGYQSLVPGQTIDRWPFKVTPFQLPHPQGSLGFRVEAGGAVFVYATDVELSLAELTPEISAMLRGADALCLDAQYTPEEYPSKKGWGHSTMTEAAKIAFATGARRLFLFHHDPAHNDEMVESMAEAARSIFEAAEPAREGKRIVLGAA